MSSFDENYSRNCRDDSGIADRVRVPTLRVEKATIEELITANECGVALEMITDFLMKRGNPIDHDLKRALEQMAETDLPQVPAAIEQL